MLGSSSSVLRRSSKGARVVWAIRFRQDAEICQRFEEVFAAKAYDASSHAFNEVVCQVNNNGNAEAALLSLLRCVFKFDTSDPAAESVLELLAGFGKQLQSYSHLDLWKAYMVMLLVKAALVPNCTHGRLFGLRTAIGIVPFDVSLHGLPDEYWSLVKCGRALLVSMDAKDGASLADIGLHGAFQMASILLEASMADRVESFIRGAFNILKAALDRDGLVYTAECYDTTIKITELIFKLYDCGALKDDLGSSGMYFWGKVPSLLNFDEAIKASSYLVGEHILSKELYLLLTIPTAYIKHKWPQDSPEEHKSTFLLVKEMIELLSLVAVYPDGSDESSELLKCADRGLEEHLRMVSSTVYLYLAVMFRDGETNHTGLFGAEQLSQAHVWMSNLQKQAKETNIDVSDPAVGFAKSSLLVDLNYAVAATKDPKYIVERGLPFQM